MAVTDLTGTKWIINTTVEVSTALKSFDIIGTALSSGYTLNVTKIAFDINSSGTSYFVAFYDNTTNPARTFCYYSRWEHFNITSWITLDEPITLAITGGTDVTNPDLIAWLVANATQQTSKIIKAGTYRFKDKLTIPPNLTDKIYIPINFTTPTLCITDHGTLIPWDDTDVYNRIILLYSDAGFTVIHNNSENLANLDCYTEEKAWNAVAHMHEKLGYTNYELANGYGQIITVTEDTEVDDDVYDWLEENIVSTTIKAGTYRFNENLTPSTTVINATIPFTVNALYVDGEQITPLVLTCDMMKYYTDSIPDSLLFYNVIEITPTTTTPLPAMLPFYNNVWSTELGNDVNTITITKDTDVDDTFATWFEDNTTMLIKAGTYRWNDEISFPPFVTTMPYETTANFTTIGTVGDTYNPNEIANYNQVSFMGSAISDGGWTLSYLFVDGNNTHIAFVYDSGAKWDSMYEYGVKFGLNYPASIKGYGQTFTLLEDIFADSEDVEWFSVNTTTSGGGDTPDEPTTPTKKFTRLYLGDVAYSSGGKCFKRLITEEQ